MRRLLFPLAVIGTLLLAAVLVWLWATDAVLIHRCTQAGGIWQADARVCDVTPAR